MVDSKLEEEKRFKDNTANNSNKKKIKGKVLKKAVSENEKKKRSHSAEPKQLKPTKKKSVVSQNNVKPVKAKKKK